MKGPSWCVEPRKQPSQLCVALMITERSDTKNNLARSGNLRHGSYCFAELAAGQQGLFFQVGGRNLEHRSPSASTCLAWYFRPAASRCGGQRLLIWVFGETVVPGSSHVELQLTGELLPISSPQQTSPLGARAFPMSPYPGRKPRGQ